MLSLGIVVWFIVGNPIQNITNIINSAFYWGIKESDFISQYVYLLTKKKYLRFDISNHSNAIRITVRPIIKKSDLDKLKKLTFFRYQIQYRLFDKSGKILDNKKYHIRQSISPSVISVSGDRFRLSDTTKQPLAAKVISIPAGQDANNGYIEVKLLSKDEIINEVVLRVQYLEISSRQKTEILWEHIAEHWKKIYKQASIFGNVYITEKEKEHLLANRWRYIAPQGIVGKDFHEYILYRKLFPKNPIVEPHRSLATSGIVINTLHKAIATLRKPSQKVLIRVFPSPRGAVELPAILHVKRYGLTRVEEKDISIEVNELPYVSEFTLKGGVLEVSSDKEVFVNIALKQNDHYITLLVPNYVRTYNTNPKLPLIYHLAHRTDAPIPLRIDIREMYPDLKALYESTNIVHYIFYDNHNNVLSEGKFVPKHEPSSFDFSLSDQTAIISEENSFYFLLPHQAVKLKLTGNKNTLITAYNRPYGIYRTRRIPEDFYTTFSEISKETGWFSILPTHSTSLEKQQRSQLLWVQRRPPVYLLELMQFPYESFAIYPEGEWSGQYILSKIATLPDQIGTNYLYGEVPINKQLALDFSSIHKRYYITPTLILNGSHQKPFNVTIQLDKFRLEKTVFRLPYQISLEDIRPGRHVLNVHSNIDVRAYINHVVIKKKEHAKRLVYKVQRKHSLRFTYSRRPDVLTVLSTRLFVPTYVTKPVVLEVNVDYKRDPSYKFTPEWTFLKQRYIIYPNRLSTSFMLNSNGELDRGNPFIVKLGNDLLSKIYSLDFILKNVPEAYLFLYLNKPRIPHPHQYKRRLGKPR